MFVAFFSGTRLNIFEIVAESRRTSLNPFFVRDTFDPAKLRSTTLFVSLNPFFVRDTFEPLRTGDEDLIDSGLNPFFVRDTFEPLSHFQTAAQSIA